jgi:hypothetical protein
LHANEPEQKLLEASARDIGYVYKRKRDAVMNTNADIITSSIAAESVFVIWLKKPHQISRKKYELFSPLYYDEIFEGLNAARRIVAVLIYRFCDNMRRKTTQDEENGSHRPYSQYLLAAMIGKLVLSGCGITLNDLTHINFNAVKAHFDENKHIYYDNSQRQLVSLLKKQFDTSLSQTDGRSLSAVFRRFDFTEKALSSCDTPQ